MKWYVAEFNVSPGLPSGLPEFINAVVLPTRLAAIGLLKKRSEALSPGNELVLGSGEGGEEYFPTEFEEPPVESSDPIEAAIDHMLDEKGGKTFSLKGRGKKPATFKKGALHRQLDVPQDKPIPPGKKKAALAGEYGPLAKKRATAAFKGILKKGRETAAAGRKKS